MQCRFTGATRTAAVFGGFLILGYQKSSAAKASHRAGVCSRKKSKYQDIGLNSSLNTFVRPHHGVVIGGGSHRFLVLQYEVAAPAGCRAGRTYQAATSVGPKSPDRKIKLRKFENFSWLTNADLTIHWCYPHSGSLWRLPYTGVAEIVSRKSPPLRWPVF